MTVTRTARRGGGPSYQMRVSALKPLYVISRAKASFRNGTLPGYRTLMDQILLEAAQGAGDD